MIHHISISAHDPALVARALATFWRSEALPFPMYPGCYIVFSGDDLGSSIEVYPAEHVLRPSSADLPALESAARGDTSGFHAAISVPLEASEIAATCEALGWFSQTGTRGGFFQVVEVWVENHTLLELLTPSMAADYRAFANPHNWRHLLAYAPPTATGESAP